MSNHRTITFLLNDMVFEYDEDKNRLNIKKHGISFKTAARVFFDYDRIEFFDEMNSYDEDRFDVIGSTSAGAAFQSDNRTIGSLSSFPNSADEVLYVVYTERKYLGEKHKQRFVTRIISARLATSFERVLYYGKQG